MRFLIHLAQLPFCTSKAQKGKIILVKHNLFSVLLSIKTDILQHLRAVKQILKAYNYTQACNGMLTSMQWSTLILNINSSL